MSGATLVERAETALEREVRRERDRYDLLARSSTGRYRWTCKGVVLGLDFALARIQASAAPP